MKVALFGATGFVGSGVLRDALAAGHEIRALIRDPAKLPAQDGLTVVVGDVGDQAAVDRTIEGTDAVISVLGPRRGQKIDPDFLARATASILRAMKRHGVRRLIAISGAGITLPGERKPFPHNVASRLIPLVARNAYETKRREFDVLAASDADWTAVRPTRVVDVAATGKPRVGTDASSLGMRVARDDLAAFMVAQLTDDRFVRQAPFISS